MSGMEKATENPLLVLIDLGHKARAAASAEELAFQIVNDSHQLWPYRQAALWFEHEGVRTLSGVVQPERNAPYVQWLERVFQALAPRPAGPCEAGDLPAELAAEWGEWLPACALWLPIPAIEPEGQAGGLLLASDQPCSGQNQLLLGEWLDIWSHAWRARFRPAPFSLSSIRRRVLQWRQKERAKAWWKRSSTLLALALVLLLGFPVHLTVLAQGEIVPSRPVVIRAPLDGVIGSFSVTPNDRVRNGQPLFSFDEAQIAARLEVAKQALATAETEYRQFAQMALVDPKSKEQLAVLLGRMGEKRAEFDFLSSQSERSRVVAPQDGVVLFEDPSEWIGRPVQTGERIMKLARPDEVEIEAWLVVGDAISLELGSPVSLYLASRPFSPVQGRLRYLAHEATPRPDGSYAYRVRATFVGSSIPRIGLKGTAKLRGGWVPFSYWVLRRPLAVIRQFLAL